MLPGPERADRLASGAVANAMCDHARAVADLTAGLSMRAHRDLCEIVGMIALSENAHELTLEHFRRAIGRMHRTDA